MEGFSNEQDADNKLLFQWPEYLVFVTVLALSMGIGVFYGFFRNQTNEEFLMAGRQMSIFPVTLSILCSFVSAIAMLSNPIEVYFYGVASNYMTVSVIPLTFAVAYLYLPVFFRLQLTSAYQYIELRFSRPARLILSVSAITHLLIYMPLTIWGPSLALDQVAGINRYWTSIVIFLVCIAYSSIGGLKAVLWSDVLQGIVMFVSMFTVIYFGVQEVGGVQYIWETAKAGGRLNFDNFDLDYRTRYTFWTGLTGGYFVWLLLYVGTQGQIQRYLSVPTYSDAKKCLLFNMFGLISVLSLCTFTGLLLFAKYHNCDPVTTKEVMSSDQIVPLFVMEVLGDIPGLPGLMVAGLTCASLSTVSSALNALPAIIVEDFVIAWYPNLADRQLSRISKLISLLGGLISFALIFVIASVGGIFQFSSIIHGTFLGPIVGVFSLGMFFPWANSWGSMLGIIPSLGLNFFFGIGTILAGNVGRLPNQKLPLDTLGCTSNHSHHVSAFQHLETRNWKDEELFGMDNLFAMSYTWLPAITTLSTVVFGLMFSTLINIFKPAYNRQKVHPKYLTPLVLKFWTLVLNPEYLEHWVEFDVKDKLCTQLFKYPCAFTIYEFKLSFGLLK